MLAPSFESEKDLNKSAQLVAYSGTPSYIAALFSFLPFLSILIGLAGWVYCIYVTYLGLGPIKKTPEDKKVVYMVISFIVMAGVYFVLMGILVAVFAAVMGLGAVSGIM
jgi:membrane associated rhomboid family serine protease